MTIEITRTNITDFEMLQGIVPDNNADIMQIGAGRMSGDLARLNFGNFDIMAGSFSAGIRSRGVASRDRYSLTMLLRADGPASTSTTRRQTLAAGHPAIIPPGAERYTTVQGAARFMGIFVTPQEIETVVGALDLVPPMIIDPETANDNIKAMTPLLDALLEHGSTMPDGTAEFYRRNILDLMTAPLRGPPHHHDAWHPSHESLVREVEHYFSTTGTRPVHVCEICEAFHVHRRALHRAFHDVLGMGPVTYMRRKRLNDVHTALRQDGPGVTVAAVAREHGFLELGRFAAAYQRMFGEKPSQTLRRTYRLMQVILWMFVCCKVLPVIACHVAI